MSSAMSDLDLNPIINDDEHGNRLFDWAKRLLTAIPKKIEIYG